MRILLPIPIFAMASMLAQRPSTVPATGTVAGTLVCTDTNLPARLASISLEPVREGSAAAPQLPSKREMPKAEDMVTIHRTHLDGSYLIAHVKPGRYYVVAQKPGYLSPVAQFTQEEVDHPTPEIKERIAKLVPMIEVAANTTTTLNLSLVRAAGVSGVVRFDDGTAASDLNLQFERKAKDGKFEDARLPDTGLTTDDLGHFHASGIPPGEYRISTSLSTSDVQTDGVFGGNHSMMSSYGAGISVFYGGTFHRKDAKIVKIEEGDELTADITIPVSKIHSVSGALTDSRTGHAINAGTIKVFDGDDAEEIASTKVETNEAAFHFEFLPEGEYTVRVKDARDIIREEIPYPPGTLGTARFKETVLKSYQAYDAPLIVQTDQTGLLLPVAAAKPGTPVPPAEAKAD